MTDPDICVVMPTVRDEEAVECLRAYASNARAAGFDTDRLFVCLVTESFCDVAGFEATLEDEGLAGAVFDGPAREAWLGDNGVAEYGHLIPEASHAQTSFGLLYLWANGFEYGVFLDDDTRPHDGDFFGGHLANLHREKPVTHVASDEEWVNVLYQAADDHGLYPRGYPYGAMDETVETWTDRPDRVVASQGLWTDVPDLDAVRVLMDGSLNGRAETRLTAADYDDGEPFVAAPDNQVTICSMNLAFRRDVVPAFYQLPMDDNDWGVGRFDDIWSGVLLKRAADLLDDAVLSGGPLCSHDKAPRPTFDDLAAEAPGLQLNERLGDIVASAARDPRVDSDSDADAGPEAYAAVYAALADRLATGDFSELTNGGFLNHVGEYMHDWLDCLAEVAPEASVDAPSPAATDAADSGVHSAGLDD
jgi:hypothetical protein